MAIWRHRDGRLLSNPSTGFLVEDEDCIKANPDDEFPGGRCYPLCCDESPEPRAGKCGDEGYWSVQFGFPQSQYTRKGEWEIDFESSLGAKTKVKCEQSVTFKISKSNIEWSSGKSIPEVKGTITYKKNNFGERKRMSKNSIFPWF